MPDLTVTWPGAVPFEAAYGQNAGAGSVGVLFDARSVSAKFDAKAVLGDNTVFALEGAVPYFSDIDDSVDQPVVKRRGKKVVADDDVAAVA